MINSSIKLNGPLCKGQFITLGWPLKSEFDLITCLRNSNDVRKYFFNSNSLDLEKNRFWLEYGINKPLESMLSIRYGNEDCFIGTIGWDKFDVEKKTIEIGRLMLDKKRVRDIIKYIPKDYIGFAKDACLTLRDYAMIQLNVDKIYANIISSNILSKKIAEWVGAAKYDSRYKTLPDGALVQFEMYMLEKQKWIKFEKHEIIIY